MWTYCHVAGRYSYLSISDTSLSPVYTGKKELTIVKDDFKYKETLP